MYSIVESVESVLQKYNINSANIIVGISGGPDSVCLTHILYSLKDKYKLNLYLVHINHKLRGKDSERDEKFVTNLAHKLNLPVIVKRINIKEIAKKRKLNIELLSREYRYKIFFSAAYKVNAEYVVTAHTCDDNTETVIYNILRGCGISGLAGIRELRTEIYKGKEIKILRPLRNVLRKDIIEYLKANNLNYRTDKTNYSLKYKRNFIRLKVLPLLEKINPQTKIHVLNLSNIICELEKFLDKIATKSFGKVYIKKKEKIIINKNKLLKYENFLQTQILQHLLNKLNLLNSDNISKLQSYLHNIKKKQTTLTLNNKWTAYHLDKNSVVLEKKKSIARNAKRQNFNFLYPLNIGEEIYIPELKIRVRTQLLDSRNFILIKDKKKAFFDYDKIKNKKLYVRLWKNGDWIYPLGMGKLKKKLHDIFIDEKIPYETRKTTLLIASGKSSHHILWIYNLKIDDTVKVTKETKKILYIYVTKKN
jgi:tRNA(Ile)-lysidine synthase